MKYRCAINNPGALFVSIIDIEQVDATLTSLVVRGGKELPGQLCFNDGVSTEDPQALADVKEVMTEPYHRIVSI